MFSLSSVIFSMYLEPNSYFYFPLPFFGNLCFSLFYCERNHWNLYGLIPKDLSTLFTRFLHFRFIQLTCYWTHYFGSQTSVLNVRSNPSLTSQGTKWSFLSLAGRTEGFESVMKRWQSSIEGALRNQCMRDYNFQSTSMFFFWFNAYQSSNKINFEEIFLKKNFCTIGQ